MATITTTQTKPFSWADFDRSALKVGDEISEVLKNGEEVTFVVMDDGVIGLKNCLAERHQMNDFATNEGGWLSCEMRRHLNVDVFALLPDDLQKIIKPRVFSSGESDNLWLFSEVEVFGEQDWTEEEEDRGTQFEYFKNPANRVKLDADGDPTWWWERSPNTASSTYFCNVGSDGNAHTSSANSSCGVCFGFYI